MPAVELKSTETNKVPHYSKEEIGASRAKRHLADVFPGTVSPSSIFPSTLTDLLSKGFLALLPSDPRVECVYWSCEDSLLRIWTVIDGPDSRLEEQIYDSQLQFMDRYPHLECDFSVVFRSGRLLEAIRPEGAKLVSRI